MNWLTRHHLFWIATLLLVALGVYGWWQYHRSPGDMAKTSPAMKVSVAYLVAKYVKDEPSANALFLGKLIQVSGTITDIRFERDTLVNLLLGEAGAMHQVSCLMDKQSNPAIRRLAAGKPVIIKGICTGFLMDVELNRCVIVTPR